MLSDERRMNGGCGGCAESPLVLRRSARCRRAFTLLELVLVMLVLTVVLAMVAPSLSGFGAGREADYAGAQVVTLCQWAHEQSITEGKAYRLNFDPARGAYQVTVQVGGVYQQVAGDFGQVFTVPEGVTMQWDAPQESGLYYVDFHPSGRVQPVRIRVTARTGQETLIGSRTATELPHVMTPEEAAAA
jgi:prepilin-type N-terminal cleavage/methylation domain-containing protein